MVLANPSAGCGRGCAAASGVSRELSSRGFDHRMLVTAGPGELAGLARRAGRAGYSGVAVVGGDGSVSLAASGVLESGSGLPVACLPCGNGNDWARALGLGGLSGAVEALLGRRTVPLDCADCRILAPGFSRRSRVVNSAGFGLDAYVLQRAIHHRGRGVPGRWAYAASLAGSLSSLPSWEVSLSVDGREVYAGRMLSLTVGVGPYVGGGMMLAPEADPADGLLDAVLIRPMPLWELVRSLPMVYGGRLLAHEAVSAWRGSLVTVRSAGDICMEVDGEPALRSSGGGEVWLRSAPGVLPVVVPPEEVRYLHGAGDYHVGT